VAEKDGREVPWDEIVKGYEYEKGKFVVLNEKDFQRVDLEATQTVDIQDFVDIEEIDPMYFYKPYYLEPQKGGDKAYVLLREALVEVIEEKVESGGKEIEEKPKEKKPSTKVIDLVAVLKESLEKSQGAKKKKSAPKKAKHHAKKAA